jgi:tetratricopeptide (TPR) repeat protein
VKRLGDPAIAGEYYFRLGRTYDVLADHERAVECARRAIEEAERCGDRTVEGKARFVLAYVGYWTGHYAEGVEHGRQAVAALEGSPERWWLGEANWVIGINHAMGRVRPGVAASSGSRRSASLTLPAKHGRLHSGRHSRPAGAWSWPSSGAARGGWPDPVGTAVARGLGASLLEKGDAEGAIPLLERSVEQLGRFRYARPGLVCRHAQPGLLSRRPPSPGARPASRPGDDPASPHDGAGWAQRTLGHVARRRIRRKRSVA